MKHSSNSSPKADSEKAVYDPVKFAHNMAEVAMRSQEIMANFISRHRHDTADTPFDPLNIGQSFMQMCGHILTNPSKYIEMQAELWRNYVQLWQYSTAKFLGGEAGEAAERAEVKDRRFKDASWHENIVFDFIRESYLLSASWLHKVVSDVEGMDEQEAKKVEFYTRQFIDALSPSNFLMTNPEVLKATLESNGENLVRGLKNMLDDIEDGKGKLNISMTDRKAFEIGKNLATTKGWVVFENELMQLIQYAPTTEKVHEVPILMIPAWINKFYILDLQPSNSLVAWLVSQGFTVFVISWVNPDASLAQKHFEDYMTLGPLAAMEAIHQRTGAEKMHTVGYCLGGTLLAATLAWLHAKKKTAHVASATYLTTMIDFSDAGELGVFIDENQIAHMEQRMSEKGYLEGSDMAITFNMLRANDLIWSFVVNNYLLGKDPFPFDLLYWNSDSTRMPAVMHSFYLRNMYQQNKLVKKNGLMLVDEAIDVSTIKTPSFLLSTREDHIAPWKSTYASTKLYKGDIEFVLAASGHIAGVINPPVKNKYSYWTNEKCTKASEYSTNPDQWFAHADEHSGSWWTHWSAWLKPKSGKLIDPPVPSVTEQKKLMPAPGTYVKAKS
jgi:polyhydroxyalkanoate synthase